MFESLCRLFAPRMSVGSLLTVRLLEKYGSGGVYTSAQVRRAVDELNNPQLQTEGFGLLRKPVG